MAVAILIVLLVCAALLFKIAVHLSNLDIRSKRLARALRVSGLDAEEVSNFIHASRQHMHGLPPTDREPSSAPKRTPEFIPDDD